VSGDFGDRQFYLSHIGSCTPAGGQRSKVVGVACLESINWVQVPRWLWWWTVESYWRLHAWPCDLIGNLVSTWLSRRDHNGWHRREYRKWAWLRAGIGFVELHSWMCGVGYNQELSLHGMLWSSTEPPNTPRRFSTCHAIKISEGALQYLV
jgi:hypothetical protein